MKQSTAEVLIVIAVLLLSLWLMGSPGGRSIDYEEQQMETERQ